MGESGEEPEEPFQIKDLGLIFSSKVFWIVALLCVLYYSAIFPFQKYAINMLQCNLDFTAEKAGMIFSVFPLGAAAITPLLGNFLDRKGKGASIFLSGTGCVMAQCSQIGRQPSIGFCLCRDILDSEYRFIRFPDDHRESIGSSKPRHRRSVAI